MVYRIQFLPENALHYFFSDTIPIIMRLYEIFSVRDFDSTYLTMGCDPDGLLISIYVSTHVSELQIFSYEFCLAICPVIKLYIFHWSRLLVSG
jgi:hypothetical protein